VIDVIGFLEDRDIDYRDSGTNVGSNDVNIDCPFCGENRKHLGIGRTTGKINCWSCGFDYIVGRRPSFVDLIAELDGCSRVEAIMVLNKYQSKDRSGGAELLGYIKEEPVLASSLSLPPYSIPFDRHKSTVQQRRALIYLVSRRFGWEVIRQYGLQICVSLGYAGRIIVPIYFKSQLVNYLGRDYTGCSELRYKNCWIGACVKKPNQILYGYDRVKARGSSHLRVVEGVTDVWRMDDDETVGLFSNKMSKEQRAMIISDLQPKTMTMFLDGDSYRKAAKIGSVFYPILDWIKIVNMGSEDVAERTKHEVIMLEENTERQRY
jgi:hypothetical protein